jgi:hypothetical protein
MNKTLALALLFLTIHFSSNADLFSSGSLEKPIDIDEKSKTKTRVDLKSGSCISSCNSNLIYFK